MTEKTRVFQFHAPCPRCGSDDNLAVSYVEEDEGHAVMCNTPHCDFHMFPDQIEAEYGTRMWEDRPVRYASNNDGTVELPTEYKKATRSFRGVKPETINRFGVYLDTRGRLVFPYHNAEHTLIGYKSCSPTNKDFYWGAKAGTGMFGVQCAHSRYRLFITEGEWDAMSLKDLTGDCGVSISCGAGSLVREYKQMISFVESFDDVFVVMDNDEAGRKACEDLKPHVNQAKVHFVQLPNEVNGTPIKDINDLLQVARQGDFDGVKRRFLDCIYASKNAVPEDVYDPVAVASDVVADMFGETEANVEISTGIADLDNALGGWRPGEMTTIVAPTSIGKSTFTRALVASLINRGHKCMIYSLEEPPRVTVRKIVELLKGDEIYYAETREQANEKAREVTDYLVVYNRNGQVDPDTMGKTIDFAVRGRGVEFVLLDNLTRAIDQSDPYNSINTFLDKLTEVSVATGVHSFCVSHTKRTDDSTNAPSIQEARGSGLIEALSSNIISLGRNRNEHRMHVCLLKNREYGVLTDTYLDYNPDSKRFENMRYYDEFNDTEHGTATNNGTAPEEEEQSEGSVSAGKRENNSVRQQSRSSSSTSDGGQRGGVSTSQHQGGSSGADCSSEEQVSRFHSSHDKGQMPNRSEGATASESTQEDGRDSTSSNDRRVVVRSEASGYAGQNESLRWFVSPWPQ